MAIYVILVFTAILIGMAISVAAFGTGGKRKHMLRDIYFSVEETDGIGVIYTKTGEYSAVLKMENPVQKYSANIDSYYEFAHLFDSIVQTLGEGYALHKQDIFTRRKFSYKSKEARVKSKVASQQESRVKSKESSINGEILPSQTVSNDEFLSAAYFRYFEGREYTDSCTYLTITQEAKKSTLFSYDSRRWRDFMVKVRKVHDQLRDAGVSVRTLSRREVSDYIDRFYAMDFTGDTISMNNIRVDEENIGMGDKKCRVYSIVDVDTASLPAAVRPFTNIEVNNTTMPVDLVSLVDSIPEAQTVVYNQIIYVPGQKRELAQLDKKKNRHASIPNPANQMAVEDIRRVQEVVARESKQLVYTHYNLVVCCDRSVDLQRPTNHLENAFSRLGIHISKRAYNQMELFVSSFPGNCYAMSADYDRFLTLSDAATCLMYKEHVPRSEDTSLKIYYTDRQGVPVAIDISGKEGRNKLTDNSNFFCLGPSGSGKSFHINSVMRQMHEQGTDVVMVDTGNSYEGLCEYVGGKYISYTEERPITMNPFKITREEINIEKINFLKNLVLQIWLGSDAVPSRIESAVVEQLIGEYYDVYFNGFSGYTRARREDLKKGMLTEIANKNIDELINTPASRTAEATEQRVDRLLDSLEERRRRLTVSDLSFNTFYEYATEAIAIICTESCIPGVPRQGIRPTDFKNCLQNFYRGGKYEKTLNEQTLNTLFDETFIVFEIDAVKDDPTLFPIVTLIIMDVFLQKMRLKKNRKVLVIEEAWKALATPLMAEYIKYMFKTARKFWASVGVVTQEIQDIIGSEIVKEAIINNSDVVMLLDQSKFRERFDNIRSILGLTDVDCRKIFTINRLENKEGRSFFREVFIRRGSVSGVYGVEEPRECYMTYTTERAEKEALKLYKQELQCSHREAIEAYCRDWTLSGISKPLPFAQSVNAAGHVLHLAAPADRATP
jgi:hypothetical protein